MDRYLLLTDLSDEERAAALERYQLLRPHIEGGVPLPVLARSNGVPLRTAERWVAKYRAHGLPGLARKRRRDAGKRRFPDQLVRLIEGLALRRPPIPIAAVHRQAVTVAKRQNWPTPSYSAVYEMVRDLDPGLVTLAHEGSKAYQEKFDLLYRREVDRPNEVWLGDHSPIDVWVPGGTGEPVRPWLTVILDDYSRAVAGYRFSLLGPSSQQTSLTLRRAIWRKADPRWPVCGIPDTFYTDNGGDFTSRHLEQVSADLKMKLVFSWPGNPRGRGKMERFFRTADQLFLCTQPGYSPKGPPSDDALLSLEDLDTRFLRFLLEDYHRRSHSETGMAPADRWEAGGFLPRMPDSLEQLDLLLLTVAVGRKVHRDGIRFQGLRYLDLTLAAYISETVTIRYDPRDMAEIRVFHNDRFLCRAICQELAGEEISLKEIIRARSNRRRELRTGLRERNAVIEALLGIGKVQSPRPDHESRAVSDATTRLKRYENE
jgi:putative transposase